MLTGMNFTRIPVSYTHLDVYKRQGSAGEYYWEGAAASLFFVDPREDLLTVFMIQKREGIDISREYKRMVYQALVDTANKQ